MSATIRVTEFFVRCSFHPNYQGKRAPRVRCPECKWIFEHRGGETLAVVGSRKP